MRFEAEYTAADGQKRRPIMIHRVVFGSIERFIGILSEHYAGKFPMWLSPVQVKVITITDRADGYAKEITSALKKRGIRAELDDRSESANYKIRAAQLEKIPYMLIIGDKEAEEGVVAVRYRTEGDLGKMKLSELIDRMAQIPGVKWIRLHYAYPSQFPYDILPVMRRHANVCNYLDIALQHISDHILQDMRRHVTKQETYDLLKRIRAEVPGIHIRTTLMVGYPGETDEDFEELKQFVRDARFERMGAFAYSEEEGTYAAKHFPDSIPEEVKQARLDELMALQEEIALESNRSKVGQELEVMVDREEDDYYVGRTEYDSPEVDPEVLIAKTRTLPVGEFCRVKIVDSMPYELMAEPLPSDR